MRRWRRGQAAVPVRGWTVFEFERLGAWASRQPDADGLVRDGAEQGDGEQAMDYEQRDHHGESSSAC